VCAHPRREEIEREFLEWRPQTQIAREFNLGSRLAVSRNVRACGLNQKRDANVRHALAAFVERCSRVRPTAAAFVAACIALSKLDTQGHSVERISMNGFDDLFHRMTRKEMLAYAEHGELPEWFTKAAAHDTGG
jgi:hypothetical protein